MINDKLNTTPAYAIDMSGERDSFIFSSPVGSTSGHTAAEINAALRQARSWQRSGYDTFLYLSYELTDILWNTGINASARSGPPAIGIRAFAKREVFTDHLASHAQFSKGLSQHYSVRDVRPSISLQDYAERVRKAKQLMAEGVIYQVNLTFPIAFKFSGNPRKLFFHLGVMSQVPYANYCQFGESHILSLSPELFLDFNNGQIITEPMKGTSARSPTRPNDQEATAALANDEKCRAENLMITDLMRNDLGQIADPGTVRVVDLMGIKVFPTVYQMVSRIEARVPERYDIFDVLMQMFPPGSVTGAPKRKSYEVLKKLENFERGTYTGTTGYVLDSGQSLFNVAIRTLSINGGRGTLGVGAGITFDSDPEHEYRECLQKAKFFMETVM